MSRTTKQATQPFGYREAVEALQLPSRPILEWSGDDLITLEKVRHIMKYTLRGVHWWGVWEFYLALPSGKSADRGFRGWWQDVTSLLDTGGFWVAILERRAPDLIVHVFVEYSKGQDPLRFCIELLAKVVFAPQLGVDVTVSPHDYHPKRGLTPHLKHIEGPTMFTMRTNPGIGWSPPAA